MTGMAIRLIFPLANTTKESLKTALAMVVAYGVALGLGWGDPAWAGFAVAFVSLNSLGSSLNKAAMRMVGTLLAGLIALAIIALFPQQRWLFMLALSAWITFCTYMQLDSRFAYFWVVAGFVSVIICVSAASASTDPFQVAMLRAQQTGLGVLVYSVVALLLWPHTSGSDLKIQCGVLRNTQLALVQALLSGQKLPQGELQKLLRQLYGAQSKLEALVDSAVSDTYSVRALRAQWQRFASDSASLTRTLLQISNELKEASNLPVREYFSNLKEFSQSLTICLKRADPTAPNGSDVGPPDLPSLQTKPATLRQSGPLEAARIELIHDVLTDLQSCALSMWHTTRAIRTRNDSGTVSSHPRITAQPQFTMPDPQQFTAMSRVFFTVWTAYLLFIYVPGLPGGASFLTTAASLAIVLAPVPFISPWRLVSPVLISIGFATILYLLVLPHLASFWGLGTILFLATFFICQLFSKPDNSQGKSIGLALFLIVIDIQNIQTYSFLSVVDLALSMVLVLTLLLLAAYFPASPRPERIFSRLLQQYLKSCEALLRQPQAPSSGRKKMLAAPSLFLINWRTRYHRKMLEIVPAKLVLLAKFINPNLLTSIEKSALREVAVNAKVLGVCIDKLIGAKESSALSAKEAQAPIYQAWRDAIVADISTLAQRCFTGDTFPASNNAWRAMLKEKPIFSESGLKWSVAQCKSEPQLRLLGLAHSTNRSFTALTTATSHINWKKWMETRFY